MRSLKFIIASVTVIFFSLNFMGCSNDGGEVSEKDMAKRICKCAEPNIKINKEIQSKLDAGNVEEATQLFQKAETTLDEAVNCSKDLYSENLKKEEIKNTLISTCGMNKAQASVLVERISEQ